MSDQKPLGADAAAVDGAGSIASDAATARHTPGPWGWDSRNTNYYLLSFAADAPHHIVMEVKQLPKDEYGTADACLIAAAPEMLIACKEAREVSAHMMRFIADNVSTDAKLRFAESMEHAGFAGFGVRIQEAIAKAEGR